ncbi:MAG: DUF5320 domain-containing protein [Anaerolineae bacterium]
MPAGDGTGPMGQGPMTGRGAGYCAGYDAPGYAVGAPGWGLGMAFRGGWGRGCRGWGFGRGWGYGPPGPAWGPPPTWTAPPHPAALTPEQEIEALRSQAQWLQEQLDAIRQRIAELKPKE